MDALGQERERRHIVAAARRYHGVAWRKDDNRQAAPFFMPLIVVFLVPGWWWAAVVAAILVVAGAVDAYVGRWLKRSLDAGGWDTLAQAREMRRRVLACSSGMVALHALPYVVLLFAPGPGPIFSLLVALAMLMLLANMHIMTRNMIFMTAALPTIIVTIAIVMLVPGWQGWALGAFTFVMLLQAANLSGASSDAFNDLVSAQLDAEAGRDALEQRVEERTAELSAAVRAAEEANKAKSMFLANMSHELRTPLNAVIGYSEIIEEDLQSGDVSECSQHIARVRGAGKHLLGLIADILDIAKADAERMALAAEEIDAPELARAIMDTVAPSAADNGTACDVVIEPGVTTLNADPLRIRQCLLNLASNAAKFTKNGRVVLRVYAQRWNDAEALAFEFADTGIGISEDVQKTLFEPFMQADASITRAYGGSGLGLYITRRLAQLMGGDVALQSKLGEGSRFTLIVPKTPAVSASAARQAA